MSLLTDEEKTKIRHHLGYLQVQEAQTFVLGIPSAVQTQFQIEGAFDRVLPSALPEIRRHLDILERIDNQMVGDLELLAVTKVAEIEVNPKEMIKLKAEYQWWRRSLANIFGVSPNPWDARMQGGGLNLQMSN